MKERILEPTAQHQALHRELTAVLTKYAAEMKGEEILALTAQMVGQVLALQDQLTMTPERAMLIIQRNIEMGNAGVIDELMNSKGNG